MKIPKSLKIGGHSYKIELVKEGELAKNDCGSLSRENNKIYIDTKLSDSNRTVTLIHEILHAVNNELSESFVDGDRKSTRLNSSHIPLSRMPSSA